MPNAFAPQSTWISSHHGIVPCWIANAIILRHAHTQPIGKVAIELFLFSEIEEHIGEQVFGS